MKKQKLSIRAKGKVWHEWWQDLCRNLNRSQKFYFFGVIAIALTSALWLTPFRQPFMGFFILSGLLLVSGVVSDLLFAYSKVWATTLGKAALLLIYALMTTVAYALATQLVNEVVGFESSKLTNTTSFAAILLVPLLILAATYILFILILIVGQIYLFLVTQADSLKKNECLRTMVPQNLERHPILMFFARLAIYPVTFGFIMGTGEYLRPKYEELIKTSTASFIFHLEAVKFSRCKNVSPDEKVINLDENEIILVKKSGDAYLFKPTACQPKISTQRTADGTKVADTTPTTNQY